MTKATIYHNPKCSTSRAVLEMLQERGVDVTVIEYLKTPPSAEDFTALTAKLGGPRAVLRKRGTPYEELGLDDPKWSDQDLVSFMAEHPVLLERPVVVTEKGAVLCRPKDQAEERLAQIL